MRLLAKSAAPSAAPPCNGRAVEDLQALPPFSDIDFVRVDSAPLLGALGGEAGLWLRGVRELMAEADLPARQVLGRCMVQLPYGACGVGLPACCEE